MDTSKLRQALRVGEQAVKDVVRGGHLGIPKGIQGKTRDWSEAEGVLIGYYFAARSAGAEAKDAAKIALHWIDAAVDGWAFNLEEPLLRGGSVGGCDVSDGMTLRAVARALVKDEHKEWTTEISPEVEPFSLTVVNLAEIRRRIRQASRE